METNFINKERHWAVWLGVCVVSYALFSAFDGRTDNLGKDIAGVLGIVWFFSFLLFVRQAWRSYKGGKPKA